MVRGPTLAKGLQAGLLCTAVGTATKVLTCSSSTMDHSRLGPSMGHTGCMPAWICHHRANACGTETADADYAADAPLSNLVCVISWIGSEDNDSQ